MPVQDPSGDVRDVKETEIPGEERGDGDLIGGAEDGREGTGRFPRLASKCQRRKSSLVWRLEVKGTHLGE